MKTRKIQLTAVMFVAALLLVPTIQAAPRPDGGPVYLTANEAPRPDGGPVKLTANEAPRPDGGPVKLAANDLLNESPDGENRPIVTIHSTYSITRGKTGSFVLNMNPVFGGMYVNFSLSGSALAGVDYVQPLSPAYIGQSGYGTILIQTLPDPRGSANPQSYSVVVTLEPGAGYALGIPSSATMWIKP
jgi:hypothetical protein